MTPERRAEINRRLAQLDYADDPGMLDKLAAWPEVELIDRTRDLNALALLEGKLPDHGWIISCHDDAVWVCLSFKYREEGHFLSPLSGTEAEARAEAIFLYLTSRDKEER